MGFPSVICTYIASTCNNASTYTDGDTYSSNLNRVIADLVRNTPQNSGYNTSSDGQSPNQVYGLLQCIGNISAEYCSTCSREANNYIHEVCANDIGGQIWLDDCFLRYDNSNFTSKLDTDGKYLTNVNNVASNLEANYKSITTDLLSNLSNQVYNDPARKGYALGSANFSSSDIVYGRVQCWRDLSVKDCRTCLFTARQTLENCCSTKQGGQGLLGSCSVRYEIYPFFETAEAASPYPSPSPPASTPDTDVFFVPNPRNVSSNVLEAYKSTTARLLSDLSKKAYSDPANEGSAQGWATYSGSDKVYALVYCSRYLSTADCRTCLRRTNETLEKCCSSRQGAQATYGNCTMRYEIYQFFDSPNLPAPPPATPTSPPPLAQKRSSSRTLSITLSLVGGIILVLVLCLTRIRKRVKSVVFGSPLTLVTHSEERKGYSPESGLLILQEQQFNFSLEALAEATEDFHEKNKLGEGGFGLVYKGMTRDGKEIAVKKLSERSAQGKREFMNEVKLVANVQHRNLVKLLGCCVGGQERLLVYEYLPNKSLDTFLFQDADPEKNRRLDWQKRYNIIIGIARGLLYLHEDSKLRIIHRDIKASNILLDEQLNPKIADFGLARLFTDNETQIQSRIAGTYGYMAPEYAMRGQLSVKADVYSFGVVLLEIMSGRKNNDINFRGEKQSFGLLEW
ncbi:hypothetical protein KI387_013851, partial [Taxus chinensis]